MKEYLTREIEYLWNGFGFVNTSDFLESTFHPKVFAAIMLLSGTLGTLALYFEQIVGLKAIVYLAFIGLAIIEFGSGIKAAIKEGQKIESRKFGRMIIKLGTYTIIIAIVNTFKNHLDVPLIFGEEVNMFIWVYYTIVNMVIIQLLISVLENLGRLGFAETNRVTQFLYFKLGRWFSVEENPPHHDHYYRRNNGRRAQDEEQDRNVVDDIDQPDGTENL